MDYRYIDLHCDTLMIAHFAHKSNCWELEGMCDVKRLLKAQARAQFMAIFLPSPDSKIWQRRNYEGDEPYLQSCLEIFRKTLEDCADVVQGVYSGSDLQKAQEAGKIGLFLTIEDGRDLQGSMERLDLYHRWGVRLITLTWNHKNCLGSPNSSDPAIMNDGLTPFGKDAVVRMQELGIIVDVSHLSDGGFWDVVTLAKKPFVASHSNARALSPHRRNLTDDMIRAIADHGGVTGLNFMPEFLHQDTISKQSRIDLMVQQARHIVNIGGKDVLCIGTDFDGFSGELEISGPDEMYKLFDGLKNGGFSEDDIEKIAWRNAQRVLLDTLG